MKKDGLTQSMNTFKRSPWEQSHVASSCNFSFIFPFPRLCRSSAEKNSKSPKCKVASVIWTWKSRDSFDADWKNSSEKSRCFRIISSEIVLIETWGWVRQFDFGNNRTRSVRELESWKRREISRSIPSEFCRLVPKFLTRKMILSTEIKCGFLCPNIVKRNSSYPYFVRFLLFFYLYYRVILNETRKMRLKIWNWFFF